MSFDFLLQIIINKQKELQNKKTPFSSFNLKLKSKKPRLAIDFKSAISSPGKLNLIAEIKKASPSKGIIVEDFNPVKIAEIYQNCGAAALSVLTEEKYFQGKLSFIKDIRQKVNLPILRKDFIIDEYQIYESYYEGADAILLIYHLLSREKLINFLNVAKKLNLACLVEVHYEDELRRVLDTPAEIIGINNRNLRDFSVDLNVAKKLTPLIPKDKISVVESGIKTKSDILLLKNLGVNAVLIGEALLESQDTAGKIKELFS